MRLRTAGLLTALALVVSGSPAMATSSGASTAKPGVGAAGIGDPYFAEDGNGGYRVGHYDIDVSYHPATKRLVGDTTVTATARKSLSRFDLDLLLRATKVKVNGERAHFTQDTHELKVTPATPLTGGEQFRVRVMYAGKPGGLRNRGEQAWFNTKGGAIALGQPQVAAWWFPSNDHPSDRATFDIAVTVPAGLEAISGGRLVPRLSLDGGSTGTWHWRTRQPMATYLAFVAIGHYAIDKGTTKSGLPYLYAYDRGLDKTTRRYARRSIGRTGHATAFLRRTWGSYPFDRIGGVATSARVGFALETQTRPVYDGVFFPRGTNVGVVVHEMAHQWFGDGITLKRWQDIWLNEGYATYSTWLYQHAENGRSTQKRFMHLYDSNGPNSSFWDRHIGDPGPGHIFGDDVYTRGAMTLHALRKTIGGDAFYELGRRWSHGDAGGVGSMAEYQALAEQISGQDLGSFFDQWLYSGDKPELP